MGLIHFSIENISLPNPSTVVVVEEVGILLKGRVYTVHLVTISAIITVEEQ